MKGKTSIDDEGLYNYYVHTEVTLYYEHGTDNQMYNYNDDHYLCNVVNLTYVLCM